MLRISIYGFLLFSVLGAKAETCDATGITTQVFSATSSPGQNIKDFQIPVPDGWVVVGGGLDAGFNKKYIYATYPRSDFGAWIVSAKDQIIPNSQSVTGYAIGLKINGVSATSLKAQLNLVTASETGTRPFKLIGSTAFTPPIPVLSAGARVDWNGWGALLTQVYSGYAYAGHPYFTIPPTNFAFAQSKDHGHHENNTINTYHTAMAATLPGVSGYFRTVNSESTSNAGSHVTASVNKPANSALVSCGGESSWIHQSDAFALGLTPITSFGGPGHLLWKVAPKTNATGCDAAAKDLASVDNNEKVTAHAVGLQWCR